jgi:hypothetical protein
MPEYKVYESNVSEKIETHNAQDVQANKGMGILSYIGLLVLIPYFGAKGSSFARHHAQQGITLCAGELAYTIVYSILSAIVNAIFKPTDMFWYVVPNPIALTITFILSLGYTFFTVLAIIGIVNAAKGTFKTLPILGRFSSLFDFMFVSKD